MTGKYHGNKQVLGIYKMIRNKSSHGAKSQTNQTKENTNFVLQRMPKQTEP